MRADSIVNEQEENSSLNSVRRYFGQNYRWLAAGLLFLLLILNAFTTVQVFLLHSEINELRQDYEHSLVQLREYPISVNVEVEYFNDTLQKIHLIPNGAPLDEFGEDNRLLQWTYQFHHTDLGLNATFRNVWVRIYIPTTAYEVFRTILGSWAVEDNTGQITNSDFVVSTDLSGQYVGEEDITNHMWKDDVPPEIEVKVDLYP